MSNLSGKQRRYLRALGHPLDAVVTVGKDGLTEAVSEAVDVALATHELIKVRVGKNAVVDRKDTAAELATATGSEVAQILGNVILLYRADPDKPRIRLPVASA
jgi:RNA-binding protein